MIWKTEHINQNTKNTHDEIQKLINNSAENTEVSASIFSLGIIGGGPKGMYALEELIDKIKKENCNTNIRVYWWNETTHFGSGPNYQTDQDDFLLINYCIGHVDAWDRRDGVVDNQLNFVQWIEQNKTIDSEVQPTDYASRALVGHYLQSTLLQIIDSKPSSIELVLIPESVEAIQLTANANFRVESVKHQVLIDNLLLATGHCYQNKSLLGCDEFRLIGVGDLWAGKTDMRYMPDLPQDKPWVILSHNPDTVDMVPKLKYKALMLSGHTHGGQVELPWITNYVMKKVSILGHKKGLYFHENANVFVTVGTGMVGIPFRFRVPPTIDIIELI